MEPKIISPQSTQLQRETVSRQRCVELGWPSSPQVKVLLVDNDITARDMAASYLMGHCMYVAVVSGPEEAVRQLAVREQNLVILNLDPGKGDDLDLLRAIRSHSDVPVILTMSCRHSEIDRAVALELGADDCITKPFSLRELVARIRAILRYRGARFSAPPRDPERDCYRFGGWQLECRARSLTNPDGAPVALTKGEYALLMAFLDAPQQPLTREHLLQATRVHKDVFDRSVDVRIRRLRRKLEAEPSAPRIIQTERGVGYVFALSVDAASSTMGRRAWFAMACRKPGKAC